MIKLIHFFSFFCSSNSSNPIFDIDSKIDLIQFLVWRKKNTPEICRVTALAVLHAALHHPVLRHPVLHPVLRHPVLHHPVLHPLSFADQPAPLVAPLNQLKQQWVSNIYIYIYSTIYFERYDTSGSVIYNLLFNFIERLNKPLSWEEPKLLTLSLVVRRRSTELTW